MVANGCITTAACVYQYMEPVYSPRDGLLAVVASLGLLSISTGLLALASDAFQWQKKLDPHFRWAVLWKVSMLVGKLILLAIPQASSEVHLDSMMSCGFDAFCPDDCLEGDGYCAEFETDGVPACKCVKAEVNWTMYLVLHPVS